MHHNALLVAAGLICPIFAVPNVNNRVNLSKGHRQAPASDGPYIPPYYGPPPPNVSTISNSSTGTGEVFSTSSSASLVINPSESPIEVAPSTSTTTTELVIVTTLPPIDTTSATPSELPTTVDTATNTVSDNAPTETSSPNEIYCGVRGNSLGLYYLATYAYNRANVPVTLEGCYQFCSIAVEQCYSYQFYLEPGLGAPRCKLYGGIVAYELESIDPFSPYLWFDVACGNPSNYIGAK